MLFFLILLFQRFHRAICEGEFVAFGVRGSWRLVVRGPAIGNRHTAHRTSARGVGACQLLCCFGVIFVRCCVNGTLTCEL